MENGTISRFIGIDPGKKGALGYLEYQYGKLIDIGVFDTPIVSGGSGAKDAYDPVGMGNLIRSLAVDGSESHVFIEKVSSMPGQGVSSMFDFGKGFGMWLGILAALQVPHTLITPQRWKKTMFADMGQDKTASRVRAGQLFPNMVSYFSKVKDDGRAESLLIAEFGRRSLQGQSLAQSQEEVMSTL